MTAVGGRETVGVLVVDDQRVFRDVAREVVNATPAFAVVGEASSGIDAVAAAEEMHPDLVLLDVRMPGMDGIAAARRIRDTSPETVVILVSIEDRDHLPPAVASCGAAELVRKQDFGPALLRQLWSRHRVPRSEHSPSD